MKNKLKKIYVRMYNCIYKKLLFFLIFIIFSTVSLQTEESAAGNYELKAFNDEKRIGFTHVYRHVLADNTKDISLSDENIKGLITLYIPKQNGKYPLVMITHGWANSKFAFLSFGRTLAAHGYAVAVFTSKQRSLPKDWLAAFYSVYKLLKIKTQDKADVLYDSIDTENIGIVAHSMGGAAALYFANFMPQVKAVTALHPYNGASKLIEIVGSKNEELGDEFPDIKGSVLILTSEADKTAYPEKTYRFFQNLNKTIPACFLSFKNIKHNSCLDMYKTLLSGGYNKETFILYSGLTAAWFNLFLKKQLEHSDAFTKGKEKFSEIENLLYTESIRKHESYPNYDARNLP